MTRHAWACVVFAFLLCAVLLCGARVARADGGPLLQNIHVCVRPPDVPPAKTRWAYAGGTLILGRLAESDEPLGKNTTVVRYIFDPGAPAESVQLLPIPHNKLKCPERVLPVVTPVGPFSKPAAKSNAPSAKETGGAKREETRAEAQKKSETEKNADEGAPDPLPLTIAQSGKPPPPPEQHPRLPAEGVTTRWSSAVLPRRDASEVRGPQVLADTTVLPRAGTVRASGHKTAAPAPGVAVPQPPPPGGKTYAESKALLQAKAALEEADRAGYVAGVRFGKMLGEAEESLKMMDGNSANAVSIRFKQRPDLLEEFQAGLAKRLNAIPEVPSYSDPKLAEAAAKGFERGYGAGMADAKVKVALVIAGATALHALSGPAALAVEQGGTKALSAALTRLKAMPVFVPVGADGAGGFVRVPKPAVAGGAGAAAEEGAAARVAAEAEAAAKARTPKTPGASAPSAATKKIPTPTVKGAGKVADSIPESIPKNWSKTDIEDAIVDYERSIRIRKAEVAEFDATKDGGHTWARKAHNERIVEEEQFLKQLKNRLKDLR